MAEIVFDFSDRLRRFLKLCFFLIIRPMVCVPPKLVRVDILLNAQPVDALSALLTFL